MVLQHGYEVDDCSHRLVWGPHVGGEEGDETLVVSHGNNIVVVDVQSVLHTVPSGIKISTVKLERGVTTLPAVHTGVSPGHVTWHTFNYVLCTIRYQVYVL